MNLTAAMNYLYGPDVWGPVSFASPDDAARALAIFLSLVIEPDKWRGRSPFLLVIGPAGARKSQGVIAPIIAAGDGEVVTVGGSSGEARYHLQAALIEEPAVISIDNLDKADLQNNTLLAYLAGEGLIRVRPPGSGAGKRVKRPVVWTGNTVGIDVDASGQVTRRVLPVYVVPPPAALIDPWADPPARDGPAILAALEAVRDAWRAALCPGGKLSALRPKPTYGGWSAGPGSCAWWACLQHGMAVTPDVLTRLVGGTRPPDELNLLLPVLSNTPRTAAAILADLVGGPSTTAAWSSVVLGRTLSALARDGWVTRSIKDGRALYSIG